MTVLSAFSGAGGDSLGMIRAGYNVSLAIDIDKDCCKTFRHNIPDTQILNQDIQNVSLVQGDFNGLLIDLHNIPVEGITGGPPCQGSSRLNYRKVGTERNELSFEIIRLAEESKAKFFLIENVPTFALKEEILKAGRDIGYNMFSKILNSGDFGVPQLRRRWFCLGLKDKKNFSWPQPTWDTPTVQDALDVMKETWGTAERSQRIMDALEELDKTPNKWQPLSGNTFDNGIAWEPNRPAPCLTHTEKTYQKIVGTPGTIPQSLSAIIQGFPPEWRFFGPKRSIGQQIVNACPPQLTEAIMLQLPHPS